MTKIEIRTALGVGFLYMVRMLGLFMVLPVIALEAAAYPGSSPFLVGVVLGIYGLTQGLLQVPLGYLSDRYGRKPVLLGALGLLLAGSVVAGLASDAIWLVIGRALQGCGAVAGALLALMSDCTRVEQRPKAMAVIGGFIGLSFGVSMVLGPVLFEQGGLSLIFWVTAGLSVLAMLIAGIGLPEPLRHSENLDAISLPSQIRGLAADPAMGRVMVSIFLLHGLLVMVFAEFPSRLFGAGIEVPDHAWYYFFILLGSLVLMYPLMRLSTRPGMDVRLLLVSIVMLGAGVAAIASGGGLPTLVAGLLVFFIAFNLLEVLLPALAAKVAPAGGRGTAMGLYSTAQFLGIFAGGLVSGVLLSLQEAAYNLVVGAGICVLWFVYVSCMKTPADVTSRVFHFGGAAPPNEVHEQLLSVQGVIDVVVIEKESVAYLKVDRQTFCDDNLPVFNH